MTAKLTVRKEYLESEVHFDSNGSSYKVVLKTANQDDLAMVKKLGYFDHLFEAEPKREKEK